MSWPINKHISAKEEIKGEKLKVQQQLRTFFHFKKQMTVSIDTTCSNEALQFVLLYSSIENTNLTQSSLLLNIFFQKLQHWGTRGSWWPLQEKIKRNILGTASRETRPFLKPLRKTPFMFSKRFKVGSQSYCPRKSAAYGPKF